MYYRGRYNYKTEERANVAAVSTHCSHFPYVVYPNPSCLKCCRRRRRSSTVGRHYHCRGRRRQGTNTGRVVWSLREYTKRGGGDNNNNLDRITLNNKINNNNTIGSGEPQTRCESEFRIDNVNTPYACDIILCRYYNCMIPKGGTILYAILGWDYSVIERDKKKINLSSWSKTLYNMILLKTIFYE